MESKLKLDALNYLDDADCIWLVAWSRLKKTEYKFGVFPVWLEETIGNELDRRTHGGALEPGLIEPIKFDCKALADALIGTHVLSRLALTANLAKFCDQLERHTITSSSALLNEMAELGVTTQ